MLRHKKLSGSFKVPQPEPGSKMQTQAVSFQNLDPQSLSCVTYPGSKEERSVGSDREELGIIWYEFFLNGVNMLHSANSVLFLYVLLLLVVLVVAVVSFLLL